MDHSSACRGTATAQRSRERMRRIGATPKGHALWTKRDDQTIRAIYPNYVLLVKMLSPRTFKAIKARALGLGVATKRHVWRNSEVSLLRKCYPTSSRDELCAVFPGFTFYALERKAYHLGLRKNRRKFKTTGYPLVDAIRSRAFELNLTMVDVDALARTKRYFQTGAWSSGNFNKRACVKAVEALGGQVHVTWD